MKRLKVFLLMCTALTLGNVFAWWLVFNIADLVLDRLLANAPLVVQRLISVPEQILILVLVLGWVYLLLAARRITDNGMSSGDFFWLIFAGFISPLAAYATWRFKPKNGSQHNLQTVNN